MFVATYNLSTVVAGTNSQAHTSVQHIMANVIQSLLYILWDHLHWHGRRAVTIYLTRRRLSSSGVAPPRAI